MSTNYITKDNKEQFKKELTTLILNHPMMTKYKMSFMIDHTSYYDGNQSYGPGHEWLVIRGKYCDEECV